MRVNLSCDLICLISPRFPYTVAPWYLWCCSDLSSLLYHFSNGFCVYLSLPNTIVRQSCSDIVKFCIILHNGFCHGLTSQTFRIRWLVWLLLFSAFFFSQHARLPVVLTLLVRILVREWVPSTTATINPSLLYRHRQLAKQQLGKM